MASNRALLVVVCCLLVGLLVGAVVPGDAAPPPRPLCDACGTSFEATAESHGVDLDVEHSTATVTVHDNGSATWVVRNRLADSDGATRVQTNDSLRTDVADRAMWDTELLGTNVSAAGDVTMRYREPDFAERSVGGAFHTGEFTRAHGYRNLDGLGADRLVVIAPDGTDVGWTVSGATVSDDGRRTTLTQLDDGGIVTFVPRDTLVGPLLSIVAVGTLVGPTLAINALAYVALPTVVFTTLVGSAAGALSWLDRDLESAPGAVGGSIALVGALVAGLSLLATGGGSFLGGAAAPVFGIGTALVLLGVALSRPRVRDEATFRTLLVGAALLTLVGGGATVAGAIAFDRNGLTLSLLSSLPLLFPVFVLLPAGYAFGRGNRHLALATATVGFVLPMIPLLPGMPAPLGLGSLLVPFVAGYAALIAVIGSPLLVLGASLATARSIEG